MSGAEIFLWAVGLIGGFVYITWLMGRPAPGEEDYWARKVREWEAERDREFRNKRLVDREKENHPW